MCQSALRLIAQNHARTRATCASKLAQPVPEMCWSDCLLFARSCWRATHAFSPRNRGGLSRSLLRLAPICAGRQQGLPGRVCSDAPADRFPLLDDRRIERRSSIDLVPAAAPTGLMKVQRVSGPFKTGHAPPALASTEDSDGPTARARVEGKRGPRTPVRGHGIMWRGSGWPPIKGSPRYTVLESAPSMPLLSSCGEGEDAESGLLPCDRRGS